MAMPIVASGCQQYSVVQMLPPIVESVVYWMEVGIPLEVMKIFAYTNTQVYVAARTFAQLKTRAFLRTCGKEL
ncbi:MAG: hypothetical protein F6K09_16495 [Merismopedia sp. SIO2A8]|nr:hypothetical protein [Merismopedia sp. SIO2A8]